jgi:ubiquinone biosynthesis protein
MFKFLAHIARLIHLTFYLIIYRKNLPYCLEKMGPAYIKLGQFLSTRPDIIGIDLAQRLGYLRDSLASFSFEQVKAIIKCEFNKDLEQLFSYFEQEPIAAASIAQVHKAITSSGKIVAVKIRRPGIKKKLLCEVEFFYFCAKIFNFLLPKYKRLKLIDVVKKIETSFNYELDLKLEAAAGDELRENNKLDFVVIPKVDWLLTSERILTIEWVDAFPIYDIPQIKNYNIDLTELTKKFAITFLAQSFDDGFFHADPHQGNILVNAKGQIVLVDFGIVGRLDHKNRIYVARILHGFIKRDYNLIADLHLKAGFIKEDVDLGNFKQNLRAIGEQIMNLPAEEISMANLLGQLFKITQEFNMEVQPQLIFLQKTMIMIEGIGKTLSPHDNLWVLAEDWIQGWAKRNLAIEVKIAQNIKHFISKFINENDVI